MASAHGTEPDAEDVAEPEEAIYEEVTSCERMELSQRLAVEELITTEASYVHNIQLCVSDIRAHLQKKKVRGGIIPPPGVWGLWGEPVESFKIPRSLQGGHHMLTIHLPGAPHPISRGPGLDRLWV